MQDLSELRPTVRPESAGEQAPVLRPAVSRLVSGTAKLATSQALSLAIGFGTAPILARLFAPREIGICSLVEATTYWVTAFGCLGYAHAIPLAQSRGEMRSLIRLCLLVSGLLLLPVVLLVWVGRDSFSTLLNEPLLRQYVWFVPLIFLLNSLAQIRRSVLAKNGQFGLLSVSNFAVSTVARLTQIVMGAILGGFAGYLLLGLSAGALSGVLIGSSAILLFLPRKDGAESMTLGAVARKYKQFPGGLMWNEVFQVGANSISPLMIGLWFSAEMTGQYSFAQRMLEAPMLLLGASVGQAFYPEAVSEWHRSGSMSETLNRAFRILSATCVFPVVAVGMLGPMLFEMVFGDRWHDAGTYSQVLCPWFLMLVMVKPVTAVFIVLHRTKELLLYAVAVLVFRFLSILLGHVLQSHVAAVMALSITGTCIYIVQFYRCLRISNLHGLTAVGPFLRELAWAIGLVLPAAASYYVLHLRPIAVALLLAAAVTYAVLVYRREPAIGRKLRDIVSRRGSFQ